MESTIKIVRLKNLILLQEILLADNNEIFYHPKISVNPDFDLPILEISQNQKKQISVLLNPIN
jgi:hypothetical protein